LEQLELDELQSVLFDQKKSIEQEDQSVTGFNLGINVGEDAGQTIFHCHVHLIPRRKGDVENPRGGVRGVIKNKQQY
jgi:diadenosine tetraphosphate (Ap4A) HIT family hydrolase